MVSCIAYHAVTFVPVSFCKFVLQVWYTYLTIRETEVKSIVADVTPIQYLTTSPTELFVTEIESASQVTQSLQIHQS